MEVRREGRQAYIELPFDARQAYGKPKGTLYVQALLAIVVCGGSVLQGIEELLLAGCAAATENMLLCAHGLGAVWCGVMKNRETGRAMLTAPACPRRYAPR